MGEAGTKPLAGKRVMVTRAAEQCGALVDALREAGAEAVVMPVVAFAAVERPKELDRWLTGAARLDWVFLTSQNAVRALEERCAALGRSMAKSFGGVRVAAIGPATAEAAQAAGVSVDYTAQVHNGVALAGELAGEVRGKRVFVPRSDKANPELIAALEANGAQVIAVVAYRTIAATTDSQSLQDVLAKGLDAALFFSPSAVHHLREMLGEERFLELGRQAVFVAIGPVTERALKEEGVERILLAADTTVAASIAELGEFFSKAGQAQPAGAKQR
ncbi:MAG TPA: uroporphyrinogen-III synthase [Candidatus Eisenbacteria bacterium]|nr:uroporphyrinogen-III synthase [Candidatus Eisenbacteria bacterium]